MKAMNGPSRQGERADGRPGPATVPGCGRQVLDEEGDDDGRGQRRQAVHPEQQAVVDERSESRR